MKRKKELALILSLLFAIVASFANVAITSKAASSEPVVTITTDKTEYSGDDEIKETVTVKNVTNAALTDVTVSGDIPEGYTTNDAEIVSGKWTKTISKIEAGKSTDVTVIFTKKTSTTEDITTSTESGSTTDTAPPDNKPSGDSNAPTTGDSPFVFLFLGLAVLSMGGIFLVKSKKGRKLLSAILVLAMGASLLQISPINAAAEEDTTETTELSYDGYTKVWADEFESAELNRNDWNVELHDPGWVNAELQEYVDSEDNIFMEDGKLVIKPIKTGTGENTTYTSGRINTQNKHNFTYGIFEARVKVPEGMGYLPAFWLMAADESVYGQWPRCGEIDIMEVMGQSTDTAHGTIHYGNPHNQSQGTYVLEDGTFSDEFHTFAVEWEPGKISWYIDGQLFYTENDWHSTTEGLGTLTYPAPFDQPFYIILNLAVGGSWVGYPDETTDFVNARYEVDYVRVYQKDNYDENVTRPEKDVTLREPDSDGNYIVNGDFAVKESLTDSKNWEFLTNGGSADTNINTVDKVTGEKVENKTVATTKDIKINGKAETLTVSVTYPVKSVTTVAESQLVIDTTNPGTLDYSVQLVQANLPMQKGATYELSFDAYADEARTMIVDVSGPDNNYARYFNDTKVNLTTKKQTFTYTFRMMNDDDPNGRLEFNLGNTDPYSAVYLSNVVLKKIGYEEIIEDNTKKVLTDGNHVYNGAFQEGENRLAFWDIDNGANAEVSVTDLADGRRLKVVVPEGTTTANPFIISQSEMAMVAGKDYAYSFDIEGAIGTDVAVEIAEQDVNAPMTGSEFNQAGKVTPANGADMSIKFTFSKPGTYYLDNVRIVEDSLIKNGDFSAGLSSFEPFADGSANASWVVDSITEDNAIDFTINNTGDAAWKVQLKQNNVELINGQWYKLSFDAKSSVDRKLMYAIQRDGSKHNDDWTPYSGEKIVDLGADYQNYSVEFQMTEPTDSESVLSISMGAVGGTQISEQHRICIDNIKLEKIDAPENATVPVDFTFYDISLVKIKDADNNDVANAPNLLAGGSWNGATPDNDVMRLTVNDPGSNPWDKQLQKTGINLEANCTYQISFKANASTARPIEVILQENGGAYAVYNIANGNNPTAALTPSYKEYTMTFKMNSTGDANAAFNFNLGNVTSKDDTITGTDVPAGEEPPAPSSPSEPPLTSQLITNGDFSNGNNGWSDNCGVNWVDAVASATYTAAGAVFEITDVGTANWHVQLKQGGLNLVTTKQYKVEIVIESSVTRPIEWGLFGDIDGGSCAVSETVDLEANVEKTITKTVTPGNDVAAFILSLGKVGSGDCPAGTVTVKSISIEVVE